MRAATKTEHVSDALRSIPTDDLHRARIEACHAVYLIEREIHQRTGKYPYTVESTPTDKLFYIALVMVAGLMTWLSVGAWAL